MMLAFTCLSSILFNKSKSHIPIEGSLLVGLYIPVEPSWLPQTSKCHLNLGNLMDVQEHITNRQCRNSGVFRKGRLEDPSGSPTSEEMKEGNLRIASFMERANEVTHSPREVVFPENHHKSSWTRRKRELRDQREFQGCNIEERQIVSRVTSTIPGQEMQPHWPAKRRRHRVVRP
ncbi:hypothetical protein J6590_055621 [Homalodisca vitripennis]|nr:hypothetical protein J6590_055621 [Homalodisca vitripennis]